MDGSRFDQLTRAIAPATRRRALALVAGGALAAAGFEASAANKGKHKRCTRKKNICVDHPVKGHCGGDPDCSCSQTSDGLVCHRLACADCVVCASDADCQAAGLPDAQCHASDDCCMGNSSCLTPCKGKCPPTVPLTAARAYGA